MKTRRYARTIWYSKFLGFHSNNSILFLILLAIIRVQMREYQFYLVARESI